MSLLVLRTAGHPADPAVQILQLRERVYMETMTLPPFHPAHLKNYRLIAGNPEFPSYSVAIGSVRR